MARRLTEKQLSRLRFYADYAKRHGRPVGNLGRDAQSTALFDRGMVYVDGTVLPPGEVVLAEDDADAAANKRIAEEQAATRAVVAKGVCPVCGAAVRRNLSITGWYQCEQLGAEGFRKDASKPSCSWQGFTQ